MFNDAARGEEYSFSNASIIANGTSHSYEQNNPFIVENTNSTGQINFLAKEPNVALLVTMVPYSLHTADTEKVILVTISPPLLMSFVDETYACGSTLTTEHNPFSQVTYPPIINYASNVRFSCPPPGPVPQVVRSAITSIEEDKWFVQVTKGEPFQFVSYDIYNQSGKYENLTEHMAFLEATFSHEATSGPNGNGSFVYIKALFPFNGTLTRPWSLTISRSDGIFTLDRTLRSCKTTWGA